MTSLLKLTRLQVAAFVLLGMSSACGAIAACTLIGCSDMLIVEFDTTAPASFRMEVTSALGTVVSIDCPGSVGCRPNGAQFADFTPGTSTVKVITAAGTTSSSVTPEYHNFKPNGEHCGPTCRIATVKATFAK